MEKFFVSRPIFAISLAIVIVLVGTISITQLPIEQYPDITPPVVEVSATYDGADAETVNNAVATPVAQAVMGVSDMLYMQATSANDGSMTLQVTFDIGSDPDLDAIFTQNNVSSATAELPATVTRQGVTTRKTMTGFLMVYSLHSDGRYDGEFLSNYAYINLQNELLKIDGVGKVSIMGAGEYAMRIWLRPDVLKYYGIAVDEVTAAIEKQGGIYPAGQFGAEPAPDGISYTYTVTMPPQISTAGEFADIVVRTTSSGEQIRLGDIAEVSLGSQTYGVSSSYESDPTAMIVVYQQPGSNAVAVGSKVRAAMERLSARFPDGIEAATIVDSTTSIDAGVKDIFRTLIIALLLVILIIYLFLQDWRATVIPLVAIPVSLVGAFALFPLLGFSINIISLLGLVLAIGLVVDDAIVVVEAVERTMDEEGLSPYEATKKAMSGLGSAIIATSLVLCAVFVPVSFLSGITGQLYRQFTITIAVSVLISTFVALTLSPALCALILRPDSGRKKNRLFRRINIWLANGNKFYERMIRGGVRHSKRMLALFGLTLVALWVLNRVVPQSFMPQEDQGYFTVELELPEGATLERTRRVTERAMEYLMSLEDVEYVLNVTGSSPRVGTNQSRSQLTVILKPWEERKTSDIRELMNGIREEMRRYPESKVYLSTPPVIPGLGASGGFELVLEARGNASYSDLQHAVDTLLHYASKRKELTGLSASMQNDIPQLYFDVDRDKAQMLGVPMADIFSTMKTFTGSVYVNDFNLFNRIYRVYIQAEAPYRAQRENLGLFFVRGADKAMIPITALGTTSYTTGPGTIRRFNMFNSATISGEAAQGYSSGQAMAILEQIARRHLPQSIGVEWSGLSYQEKHVSGQTGYVLALAFLFVFLFLAAQYESWLIPIAVILSLPIAGIGAYLGNWACGLENNIYFQIGLVMLVGLVAKNAILIVEFAKDEVEKGRDILTAVIMAAHLRFRPIVMTSLAFILGMLPLVFASGPGSASRQGIGTGVFFGMLVAITVGIVFVPLFFVWVYKAKEKWITR